jgi:ABC-type oligopeptide transport system substrate-binding subunit
VTALLLVTVASCKEAPVQRGTGEIRLEAAEPGSLDPARADDADEIMIVRNVFKGLVDYDPKTAAVRPASATRWKVSADARQFTFTLRHDNGFSNGEPVKADNFVRAFNRAASKAVASPLASKLSNIVGYQDYRDAKTDTLAGVKALDEYRLEITLVTSDADFVAKLGQPVFSPLPSEAAISTQKPTYGERPIGNGPFMVDEWKHNEAVRLVPNPRWYGTKPALALVTFVLLSDLDLAYEQWQAGNLDWTRVPPNSERQAEAQNQSRVIKKSPSTLLYLVAITDLSPTRNLLLRQAISQSIDRRAISTRLSAGLDPPATGIFPPGMPGHRDGSGGTGPCFFCLYDPGKARDLLSAGRVPANTLITLAYPAGLGMDEWVDEAAASIQRATRLPTRVVPKRPLSDYRAFLKGAKGGLFGAYSLTMSYPSPESFLQTMLAPGGDVNYSRWSNPAYDQYTADARVARDDMDRLALYRRAEDLVLNNLPIVPLWWRGELRLVNLNRFTGLDMDAFGYPTLENAAPKKATPA